MTVFFNLEVAIKVNHSLEHAFYKKVKYFEKKILKKIEEMI